MWTKSVGVRFPSLAPFERHIMKFYKIILLPIKVCVGDYCWDGKRICGHFDNYGGHATCLLKIDDLQSDETGYYPKPKKCKDLPEI